MSIICRIQGSFMSIWRDLHFNKGVRIAVGVHGGQMGAAYDTNHQAALLCVIAQWHQDAAALGTQQTTASDTDTPVSILMFPSSVNAHTKWRPSKFLKTHFTFHNKHKMNKQIKMELKLWPQIKTSCNYNPGCVLSGATGIFRLKLVIKGLIWAWQNDTAPFSF